jgi:Type I restriction enzyme HindI endonuclease subunit-like, C-terminal
VDGESGSRPRVRIARAEARQAQVPRDARDGGSDVVSVDWMHREAARARMRVLVKRILRKYGYPPDLQDAAVQNVLQQAEALSAEWAA